MRNNNQAVEVELARVYYKKNRRRNQILIAAIAMANFLLYAAFSIADGKIRSDYLIDVRGMGTLATVSLENGSERQFKEMEKLSYLSDVGIKKVVMKGKYQKLWSGNLTYVDDNVYVKMLKPAVTNIHGSYPVNENEVMLPVRCFQQMGIDKPELGVEIPVELEGQNGEKEYYSFFVSGYYTDYIDSAVSVPELFVSKKFLEKQKIPLFPVDRIMATQKSLEDGKTVERRLYSDITMEYDAQQIFGENPMAVQSVEGVFGSISIAAGCGFIVVFCAFILIYNVVSISMGKDIQQYGLLKMIGTTNRQLRRIACRQNIWNIIRGNIIGGCAGVIIVGVFLRYTLQRLFMQGYGESDVSGFYPWYLILTIGLLSITTFFAESLALKRVMKWNAIESVRYVEADVSYRKRQIKAADNMTICKLAWRNVTRSKRRLWLSVVSVLLGAMVALGAVVIMQGTDLTNKLEQNPDFQLGILAGIFRYPEKIPSQINDDTQVLSQKTVETIINMNEIERETVNQTRGSYAVIDFGKDAALHLRKESIRGEKSEVALATIQVVDEEYISKIEKYVENYKLSVDVESWKTGNGCILLHHNELSQILEQKAKSVIGQSVHFYSLNAYADKDNMNAYEKGSLSCAGYLDMTDKYFPELQMTSIGNMVNYFIMTKEAFQKLGFSEKIFDVSFDVKDDYKIVLHQKLSQIVQQENVNSGEMDTFYLNANYLLLQAEENRIRTANIILGVLAAFIFVIGIMNFTNSIVADHNMRKTELAVMESVGLTKVQLRRMIFMEGFYYWTIIILGLISVGSMGIWILGKAISQKLLYFKFIYPWKTLLLLALILLFINLILAQIMYYRGQKQTLNFGQSF